LLRGISYATPVRKDANDGGSRSAPRVGVSLAGWVSNVQKFEDLAANGQATLQDAQAFLQRSKDLLDPLPHKDARAKAAELGAGRILLWLWKHRAGMRMEGVNEELCTPLCWFLHAEGLEDFVWRWIIMEA